MSEEDLELAKIREKKLQKLLQQQKTSLVKDSSSDNIMKTTNESFEIPSGLIHLNDATFEKYINKSPLPVFVDFWAEWCQPCKLTEPIIEALERRYRGKMVFAKVNVDENPYLSGQFTIQSIPAFHIWYQKKLIDQFVGALPGQKFDARVHDILENYKLL